MKEVTCKECGATRGEEFRTGSGTYACPSCGSTNIHVHVILVEIVSVHDCVGIKARREGERKPFREVFAGGDLRRRDGKWMEKKRVIDREQDLYEERVVDPETGEVVHECSEPLTKRNGHGSAKKKLLQDGNQKNEARDD